MAAKRAAFVTGGSSGIGLELAMRLAARGHPVAIFARDADRLAHAAEKIKAAHPGAIAEIFPADVGDRGSIFKAVANAVEKLGQPDWAIANAGIAEAGHFLDQASSVFEDHMRTNYMGALHFAKAVAPAMGHAGGRLIFIASGAAIFGIAGYAAYAPSKFAMRGLAEVLRVELAPKGISVTLAYPPDTDTPMLEREERTRPPVTRTVAAAGGIWSAKDVAALVLRRAEQGKFTAAPGIRMQALLALHSIIAPILRNWQSRAIRNPGS